MYEQGLILVPPETRRRRSQWKIPDVSPGEQDIRSTDDDDSSLLFYFFYFYFIYLFFVSFQTFADTGVYYYNNMYRIMYSCTRRARSPEPELARCRRYRVKNLNVKLVIDHFNVNTRTHAHVRMKT